MLGWGVWIFEKIAKHTETRKAYYFNVRSIYSEEIAILVSEYRFQRRNVAFVSCWIAVASLFAHRQDRELRCVVKNLHILMDLS